MKILATGLLSLGWGLVVAACASTETTAPATTPIQSESPAAEDIDDGAVACDACFPLEALPDETRAKAETILLEALDTEALYTLLSDLKPMSSGFASLAFPASEVTVPELETLRAILQTFHCTPRLTGDVQVFATAFEGEKSAEALLFHRPRFAATIEKYANPFEALQIDASMEPIEAVNLVDRDPTSKRFRAYGYFFGYPKHAVDFFVSADESESSTGQFVERDFVHIPTFAKATGAFTYAVPKGHELNAADRTLREKAAPVLAAYKQARAEHIAKGKGVALLLRAVFDDGNGRCKPENAAAFVEAHGAVAEPKPEPTCADPGDHCSSDADCCSGDCHGDHCH